jgi:hypothetical protein
MPKQCCKDMYARIPDDEPVFTIRGQDALALQVINYWIVLARSKGVSQAKIDGAAQHHRDIQNFQFEHPELVHLPD